MGGSPKPSRYSSSASRSTASYGNTSNSSGTTGVYDDLSIFEEPLIDLASTSEYTNQPGPIERRLTTRHGPDSNHSSEKLHESGRYQSASTTNLMDDDIEDDINGNEAPHSLHQSFSQRQRRPKSQAHHHKRSQDFGMVRFESQDPHPRRHDMPKRKPVLNFPAPGADELRYQRSTGHLTPTQPITERRQPSMQSLRQPDPQEQEYETGSSGMDEGAENDDEEEFCTCGIVSIYEEDCYFCWPCNGQLYCNQCWDQCPPHRPPRRGVRQSGPVHEKTDPKIGRLIQMTIEADFDDDDLAGQHGDDEDTSWFGAGRDEDDIIVFTDHGRYSHLIAERASTRKDPSWPALVSFVGQTGAGKSSLIKLLIELQSEARSKNQVPVVGSMRHQDTPTSGDVHLYRDPSTFLDKYPVLYADCEGLDGGEREPMGSKFRRQQRSKRQTAEHKKRTNSLTQYLRSKHNTSEREIAWATSDEKRSREYHVRNLYPRLLYTFSDVIVFVMKNSRVIESVIEQLIKWADAALETSSNQPVLPHAVIVLNAYSPGGEDKWDVEETTLALMEAAGRSIHTNHTLRKYAEEWRARKKSIETVEMLLLSYYSSIRVVRVPDLSRPGLICKQVQLLYKEIQESSERSRDTKHSLRMLLNADELQPYLQYAFDHFSRDLGEPFDFVRASFANNPIPSDFGGNILKLAINVMDVWKNRLDGPGIFQELSFVVASCIMLECSRRRTMGPAEKLFPEYMEPCDDALDDFVEKYWPCEFVSSRGRCVNVRSGHNTKGHQLETGEVLEIGDYQSSFSSDTYRQAFRDNIYRNLRYLLDRLQRATQDSKQLELEAGEAAKIHRDDVLRPFYNHLDDPSKFISHTACFCCLIYPPEHALPCGHVLCTPCVQSYGESPNKGSGTVVKVHSCPLHAPIRGDGFTSPWPVSLKPPGAGVRVLSLDGGGVRGIVELTILEQLERALGPGLPVQLFFDLIVGTSAGGLVALGLGAKGWSVEKCSNYFKTLCEEAFTKRDGIGLSRVTDFFITAHFHSRYNEQPLESVLKSTYGQDSLFGGSKLGYAPDELSRLTKVAVTTVTTTSTTFLLTNYNRLNKDAGVNYQLYRSERPADEFKMWEAARATSALPGAFRSYMHGPSGQVFQDGAISFNNPVEVAMKECQLLWPDVSRLEPDIFVSCGSAFNPNGPRKSWLQAKKSKLGMGSYVKNMAKIALDHVQSSLHSEQTWWTFLSNHVMNKGHEIESRYVRLNVELNKDLPRPDAVQEMANLEHKARSGFIIRTGLRKEGVEVLQLADRLIATCFYFEKKANAMATQERDGLQYEVKGYIRCRFPDKSPELQSLGEALHRRSQDAYKVDLRDHYQSFKICEPSREVDAQQLIMTPDIIERMRHHGRFQLAVTLKVASRYAQTDISMSVGRPRGAAAYYPISGFPRHLMDEDDGSRLSHRASVTSMLGRRRTPDRQSRRGQWSCPLIELNPSSPVDVIQRFGDPSYRFPGNATQNSLESISQRFSPPAPIPPPIPTPSIDTVSHSIDPPMRPDEIGTTPFPGYRPTSLESTYVPSPPTSTYGISPMPSGYALTPMSSGYAPTPMLNTYAPTPMGSRYGLAPNAPPQMPTSDSGMHSSKPEYGYYGSGPAELPSFTQVAELDSVSTQVSSRRVHAAELDGTPVRVDGRSGAPAPRERETLEFRSSPGTPYAQRLKDTQSAPQEEGSR